MHNINNTVWAGQPLAQAKRVLIMTHGRGASAQSILSLAAELNVENTALVAPQATGNTWYPYSFLAPENQNEPGLSAGLQVLSQLVEDIKRQGFDSRQIYLLGFSQGACLTAEFAARNAQPLGGVFILSGGVIGDSIKTERYSGDFEGTPIFLGCSDVDSHVPLHRVQDSTEVFKNLGANVTERIYPNAPHSVFQDEINHINQVLNQA
ncbi:alpha/beta hydrolase [Runella salmonicolor]|uniref:Dienelactone hydrolase family protein n=1 Tax=Runella salmonicolor TaxID=2950278 RepID=A0ABT1FS11_9BACT|nr:dienelactone hydrolase family protein [Runella salmonicolor]MCP1383563.1 dienelactone hydrolase family protein [Runella salmonicolor]